jgi:hypothetical protein
MMIRKKTKYWRRGVILSSYCYTDEDLHSNILETLDKLSISYEKKDNEPIVSMEKCVFFEI